jgi:hypothetical protein
MTGEQIAKVVLDKMGFDEAVYRLGFNKVVGTIPYLDQRYYQQTNKNPYDIRQLTLFFPSWLATI